MSSARLREKVNNFRSGTVYIPPPRWCQLYRRVDSTRFPYHVHHVPGSVLPAMFSAKRIPRVSDDN